MSTLPSTLTTAQLQALINAAPVNQVSSGNWQMDLTSTVLKMTITVAAASASAAVTAISAVLLLQASDAPDVTNLATILTNLTNQLNTIETWITNNPSGAVLTAAQTLVVARMLAGLTRVAIAALSTVGGS
jgi:hypothetical protein